MFQCVDSTHSERQVRKRLARTGLRAFLQTALEDDFVHADLHPGNVIGREADDGRFSVILIDAGMVAALNPADGDHFFDLDDGVVRNQGEVILLINLSI